MTKIENFSSKSQPIIDENREDFKNSEKNFAKTIKVAGIALALIGAVFIGLLSAQVVPVSFVSIVGGILLPFLLGTYTYANGVVKCDEKNIDADYNRILWKSESRKEAAYTHALYARMGRNSSTWAYHNGIYQE